MTVVVRLFGPQAVLAGTRELSLRVSAKATAGEVRGACGKAVPQLVASLPYSRIAINHEFVSDDAQLRDGDEVALIGMLSGG